jgi:hypothetical protein
MFRSQSKSKSLKVQRETVRILAGAELSAAQGGAGFGNVTVGTVVVTVDENCPRPPDINGPTGRSMSAPGNGCGPQIPGPSIIINPPIFDRP